MSRQERLRDLERALATVTHLIPPARMSAWERLEGLASYERFRAAAPAETFQ